MIKFALAFIHGDHLKDPKMVRQAVLLHSAGVGLVGIAMVPTAIAFMKDPNIFLASVLGLLALIAAANAAFAAEARRLQKGGKR